MKVEYVIVPLAVRDTDDGELHKGDLITGAVHEFGVETGFVPMSVVNSGAAILFVRISDA